MCISEPMEKELTQHVEVTCIGSGKKWRFAAGSNAEFAVNSINRRLIKAGDDRALGIEAVKEGEERIGFSPDSVLVNYGTGWKLQTVTGVGEEEWFQHAPGTKGSKNSRRKGKPKSSNSTHGGEAEFTWETIAKILVFVFALLWGFGISILAAEVLPKLILSEL